jgi:succinate dehydrogenase/fumarate reductase cytochrome b subunit
MLRINNILDKNIDTDFSNNLEAELYNVQNIILRTFVRNIINYIYHYLINSLPHIKDQYFILQKYIDLETHMQIYETAKKLYIMKFNTIESTISTFNSFYNTITNAELTIIQKLLSYIFLTVLAPYFGSAIHHILADTPQILQLIL